LLYKKSKFHRVNVVLIYSVFLLLSLLFGRRFFDLENPTSHYMMDGDPALNTWTLDWVTYALKTNPSAILDGNAFFPYPRSILLSESMLSLAFINVFTSPLRLAPWFGYNFLVFLSYFASAVGGFLLIREWTGSTRAGIWGGVFWAFLFFRVHHMSHLQILSFEWMPFCALFLVRAEREPSLKNWGGFTLFFLLQALVSWYLAIITILLLLIVALCTVDKAELDRRHLLPAMAATILCVMPLAALAIAYASAGRSSTLTQRYASVMSATNGVHLSTFFFHYGFPPDATLLGSRIPGNKHWVWGENTLYVGYVPLLLAIVGLRWQPNHGGLRLRRMGIALAAAGAILAVGFVSASGLKLPLYYLAVIAPILTSLRAPQRFSLLIYFGVMLLSSVTVARFDHRIRKPWVVSALFAVACAVFLLEVYPVKLPYDGFRQKFEYSVIDRGIEKIQKEMGRRVAAIHYPIYTLSENYPTSEAGYMLGSTLHHAYIVNGFSGAEPNGWMDDLRMYNTIPDERAFTILRKRHVDLICLHPGVPPQRRQSIISRFRQLGLGDVLLSDDVGNVILRLVQNQ
jgi:hypothetical protein